MLRSGTLGILLGGLGMLLSCLLAIPGLAQGSPTPRAYLPLAGQGFIGTPRPTVSATPTATSNTILSPTPTPSASPTEPSTATTTATSTPVATDTPTATSTATQTAAPTPTPTADTPAPAGMLWIPTGAFPMGSPSGTGESDERPQHSIYVDAFYIDRVEVTNAQYRACVLAGVCRMPAELDSPTRESYFDEDAFAEYPVIYVSWSDAETYCAWADKRLPTEAEWEKAARGLDGRRYPWGDQPPAPDLAQYGQPDSDTARTGDHPAGASPYGLHDAAGNVWEWVSDWYSPTYYSSSPAVNPTGPGAGARKVLRGGSWDMDDSLLAAANRFKMAPDHRSFNIGFRCAHNK